MIALRKLLTDDRSPSTRLYLCRSIGGQAGENNESHPLVLPTSHHHSEVAICTAGAMRIVSRDAVYSLSAGDAVLIEPNAWHYESYEKKLSSYRSFWISISSDSVGILSALYRKGVLGIEESKRLPQTSEELAFAEIRTELLEGREHWQMKSAVQLKSLLIDLERRFNCEEQPARDSSQEPLHQLFYIIKTRFREPLQIRQLAREVGMSPDHLSRRFHAHYGVTFKQCLNTTRINHARHLLLRGCSIKKTAEAAGFEDVYYFSKVFKEYSRVTPGQFGKIPRT